MLELKDTIELMLSDKWEERLIAEYLQATIRAEHAQIYLNGRGAEELSPFKRIKLKELRDANKTTAEKALARLRDVYSWRGIHTINRTIFRDAEFLKSRHFETIEEHNAIKTRPVRITIKNTFETYLYEDKLREPVEDVLARLANDYGDFITDGEVVSYEIKGK